MAKTKRKLPLHCAIELLTLIMGITISFMLNEWRISNNEAREQRRLVRQLVSDLQADTAALSISLELIDRMDSIATRLCGDDTLSINEASNGLPMMVNTVSQTFHHATYSEMESTGKLTLIESDSLRQNIICYYSERLPSVYEWHAIDRDQALPDITRFYKQHLPYAPFFRFEMLNAADSLMVYEAIQSSAFKNQIQSSALLKQG